MDELGACESNFQENDIEEAKLSEFVRYSLTDCREIAAIPATSVFISEDIKKRQQVYTIELHGKMNLVRRQGIHSVLSGGEFFFLEACDQNGRLFSVAVRPEFIWNVSGYWLTVELVQWSIDHQDDEIFNILFYALSSVCDFFGWSLRRILPEQSQTDHSFKDGLFLLNTLKQTEIVVQAGSALLDQYEFSIRQYSVQYHKNCLWLGKRITFKINVYLDPIQSILELPEVLNLNIGDLIPLKQVWPEAKVVKLAAYAICWSMKGSKWRRKIFLRIDHEDARMEFGNEDWDLESDADQQANRMSISNPEGFKMGERGPDAVELDISVGNTTISFNELCNIQEGSLIEISRSSLPLVKMNVAGQTILEGELVRIGQQLMVQVTKKVG